MTNSNDLMNQEQYAKAYELTKKGFEVIKFLKSIPKYQESQQLKILAKMIQFGAKYKRAL